LAGQAFLARELGSERESPVVEAVTNNFRAQGIGRSLESFGIVDRGKGVVLLAEGRLLGLESASRNSGRIMR
jgi:hypothetical protein